MALWLMKLMFRVSDNLKPNPNIKVLGLLDCLNLHQVELVHSFDGLDKIYSENVKQLNR